MSYVIILIVQTKLFSDLCRAKFLDSKIVFLVCITQKLR